MYKILDEIDKTEKLEPEMVLEIQEAINHAFRYGKLLRSEILKLLNDHAIMESGNGYSFYNCEFRSEFKYRNDKRFFSFVTPLNIKKSTSRVFNKLKETISILKKDAEKWESEKNNQWTRYVVDLVRFRIVCCFLSDVFKLACHIGEKYRFPLSVYESSIKDYILSTTPNKRSNASKSIHFRFPVDNNFRIELQLMTLLHFGWDQIEHAHYEKVRVKGLEPGHDDIMDKRINLQYWAASDALYLFDEQFMLLENQWFKAEKQHNMKALLDEWGSLKTNIENNL